MWPSLSSNRSSADLGTPSPSPPVKPSVYKSRLCVFNAAGRCSHGSACSFAHSAYELSDPKTVICPKIEQFGFCDDSVFNSNTHPSVPLCPFAHDPAELRQLPKVIKTALCRYYPQGRCKAGTACRHAHAIEDIDPACLPSLYTPETANLTSLYVAMAHQVSQSALTTPSPIPSPRLSLSVGQPLSVGEPAHVVRELCLADGEEQMDLQSLQASLLALALELEKLRTRGQ